MSKRASLSIIIMSFLLIVAVTIAISFAFWIVSKNQTTTNVIATGNLSVEINKEENAINLEKAIPISDEEAENLLPFTFTIINNGNTYTNYTVNLEMLNGNTLKSEYVASKIDDNDKKIVANLQSSEIINNDSKEARTLVTGSLKAGQSVTYNLRLWIDKNVELNSDTQNKKFEAKIVVIANAAIDSED